MTETTNAVALSTRGGEIAQNFLPDLFSDIDFNGLSGAIDKMGEASHTLSIEEKQMAVEIVGDWNSNVVKRLRDKEYEMNGILSFFSDNLSTTLNHMKLEEFGEDLAEKTSTQKTYKAIEAKTAAFNALIAPERPVKGSSTTIEEQIKSEKLYEAENTLFGINRTKAEKELNSAIGAWKRALLESDVVKELLKDVRKYKRGFSKLYTTADDKAQLAKISISISSKDAREALKSLFTFSTTI